MRISSFKLLKAVLRMIRTFSSVKMMYCIFDRSLLKIFKDEPFDRNKSTKSSKKVDAVAAAPEVKDSSFTQKSVTLSSVVS